MFVTAAHAHAAAAPASDGSAPPLILAVVFALPIVLGLFLMLDWDWGESRRRRERLAEQAHAARLALFEHLADRHAAISDAWTAYRDDLDARLALPALDDVRVPTTAAFVRAAGRAQDLCPSTCPDSSEPLLDYDSAVQELEEAWQRAVTTAKELTYPTARRVLRRVRHGLVERVSVELSYVSAGLALSRPGRSCPGRSSAGSAPRR